MTGRTLVPLTALLFGGILTLWVPGFAAIGVFQAGVFLLGIVWVWSFGFRAGNVRFSLVLAPLAAALVWPLVQVAAGVTIYRWDTLESFWTGAANFVCFFLALQIASDPLNLRRFVTALLYFGFGLSMLSVVQMFTSEGKVFWIFPSGYTNFVLGPFINQNQYAAFIELVLPIALYFALFNRRNRTVYAVMAAVMTGSVVASASRAGTVLVLLELLTVPLLALALGLIPRKTALTLLAEAVALAAVSAAVVGFGLVWERLRGSDPYFLRREVMVAAGHMFRDRPAMGFGLGTWATAYPAYAIFDPGVVINQAHNDWAQWAVEGGLPFFLFMLAAAALLVRPALRSVWGAGVLFVLLHCLVDYPLQQRPAFAALFFAVAGAVASAPSFQKLSRTLN